MYYLSNDFQDQYYYISSMENSDSPYLIRTKERYRADELLRKLNGGSLKNPEQDPKSYQFVKAVKHPKLSAQVHIFELKVLR